MALTLLGLLAVTAPVLAQEVAPQAPIATRPPLPAPKTLPHGEWEIRAQVQESDGPITRLKGHAEMEDNSMLLRADDIEYNDDTKDVVASGHVYFHDFDKNEQLWCDHVEYNTEDQKGKFYVVRGETMPKVVVRRGVLSGNSPFHFEGEWAERIGDKYLLYNGWITNCKMPKPWWIMRGRRFDIVQYERVKSYHSTFLLRNVPIFFTPYFYHSLEKQPRHSGFLIPNLVPHSQRGFMVGLGYFWAINRSYDVTYRLFDYNTSAFAHHVDFRGKPRPGTDFDLIVYGVQDRGGQPGTNPVQKYSGMNIYFVGKSDLGNGWTANGFVNYVSTFRFRQEWSESFNEAIGSEIHSSGFLNRNWSTFTFNAIVSRLENFQSIEVPFTEPNGSTNYLRDAVLIHKLPEAEFSSRDRQIFRNVPVWFSFYSAAGLLYRSEPIFDQNSNLLGAFQTRQFMPRLDFAPHVTTALHMGPVDLVPSVGVDETYYGESQTSSAALSQQLGQTIYQVDASGMTRSARDFSLDLILPSLGRVFDKKTVFGDKLKHVIEPRATYRYVTGIGSDFNRFIPFDETDLLANTSELQLSLTNRIYAKRGDNVQEIFTWELKQKRYFDPTFGGALVPGQANVFLATTDLTAYAFLVGPRTYSPLVSTVRVSPITGLSINWQADYDPKTTYFYGIKYGGIVDSSFSVDYHWKKYFVSAGNNEVHISPLLTATANQYRGRVGFGDPNNRGWNAGIDSVYDYRQGHLDYMTTQVTYNTDCCGFSVQYRRYNVGVRDESRFTIAFAIANVGTFGTLKKQDRLF